MNKLTHIFSNRQALKSMAAVVVTLCLWSCTSDEPAQGTERQDEIAVSGNCGSQSRYGDFHDLPAGYGMWVTAFYNDANSRLYLFRKAEFELNTSDNHWYGKDTQYFYPLQGKLDFFAYATQTATKPAVDVYPINPNTDNKDYIYKATLNYAQGTSYKPERWLNGHDDVLVAEVTDDVPCGNVPNREVELKFHHILSNLRFTFTAETQDAQENFRVARLEINNLYLTGQAVFEREARGDNWKPVEWNTLKNQTKLVHEPEGGIAPKYVEPGTTTELPTVDFFIPVQEVSPQVADELLPTFSVYYLYQVGDNKTEVMDYMIERTFTFPSEIVDEINKAKWEAGKRYTYNIMCKILPHIEFLVTCETEDLTTGFVMDKWQDEDPIGL